MAAEAPPFWWEKTDWRARALYPVSRVYGSIARRRMVNARREKLDVPALCVGHSTVGGTGKTPVAIALAKQAQEAGVRHLVLTHLIPYPDGVVNRYLFTRGMSDHFDGEITVGEDGMQLVV